ncbi:hypothetical protein K402DRAFT_407322 [Aulographum hederae CBS 113979]|uniref:Uncharacterized protein n=1 Tax=Aulographum hederae CBS 113979 TaxID=1176131 RepID=A0A6G1GPG3_9PEZI|nr:hypothetical protein K402DRAFT_407322 [Aulographum hederae CBS 113979]
MAINGGHLSDKPIKLKRKPSGSRSKPSSPAPSHTRSSSIIHDGDSSSPIPGSTRIPSPLNATTNTSTDNKPPNGYPLMTPQSALSTPLQSMQNEMDAHYYKAAVQDAQKDLQMALTDADKLAAGFEIQTTEDMIEKVICTEVELRIAMASVEQASLIRPLISTAITTLQRRSDAAAFNADIAKFNTILELLAKIEHDLPELETHWTNILRARGITRGPNETWELFDRKAVVEVERVMGVKEEWVRGAKLGARRPGFEVRRTGYLEHLKGSSNGASASGT